MEFHIKQVQKKDLAAIAKISDICYSVDDSIPLKLLRNWFHKSPSSFFLVADSNQQIVGNFTILAIKHEKMSLFIAGDIIEKEFTALDIQRLTDKDITCLYIESISTLLPKGYARAYVTMLFVKKLKEVLRAISSRSDGYIYSIAASTEGAELAKHLGFKKISCANTRKDQHDLYRASFDDIKDYSFKKTINYSAASDRV